MLRKVSIAMSVVAVALFGLIGIADRATAATTPIQLIVPQGTAFAALGYDCGGIGEHVYATGFDSSQDPAEGYPTGDVLLSTTCNGSGRGGHSMTHNAWTADTWDPSGALESYSVLSAAPNVDPSFSTTDAPTGNLLYNTTNFRCTSQTGSIPTACFQWADGFAPRPRVTGVSPSFGASTGGTSVTVTGDGFTTATAVDFGGTDASFTVNSDTSITATSPAVTPGTVDVTVVSAGGTSLTGSSDQFTSYGQPTVTGVSPNSGPTGGGYDVTVTGTNFVGTTGVAAGDTPTAFQVVDDGTLSVYIPPSDSGPGDSVDITVTSPGGTSPTTPADQFTYTAPPPPPSVATSPAKGRPGKKVKLTGAGFPGSESVSVDYMTGLSSPDPESVTICTATTTPAGTFNCKGNIPAAPEAGAVGDHTIVASDVAGDSASADFLLK